MYKQNHRKSSKYLCLFHLIKSHAAANISFQKVEHIKTAFKELKTCLKKTEFGNEMELYLGCELMYSESLAERLESKTSNRESNSAS